MILLLILTALFSKYVLSPKLESDFEKTKFEELDSALKKQVQDEKKDLPLEVEAHTTWTDAEYKDLKIKYTYVIKKADVPSTNILNQEHKNEVKTYICKELAQTIKYDVEYTYFYEDEDKNKIEEIVINKANCFI